jgi:hypothetical protein
MSALADGGLAGGGARAAGHMNGVRDLVKTIFVEAGMPGSSIVYEPYLPGYYRARKRWDMAVVYKGSLVAAVEFKSMVGSVGKNINNRFEEALGNVTDARAAQQKFAAFGKIDPWFGYVFVLREDNETERAGTPVKSLFGGDPAFDRMSYSQRFQEMLNRVLRDNIYQAGWFITTKIDRDGRVSFAEPLMTASGAAFRTMVEARVNLIRKKLG